MLRAMYTSISGLRNHQAMLDVTAANIANVNTYGFKASTTSFKDLLSQTLQGASGPTGTLGGTNNRQIGLGMTIDSISQRHTQGNLQSTGVWSDLAIQGDGFFRVSNDNTNLPTWDPVGTGWDPTVTGGGNFGSVNPAPTFYQRAGNFALDANGDMVTQDGYYLIGHPDSDQVAGTQPDLASQIRLNIPPATSRDVTIGQDGMVTRFDTTTNTRVLVGWVSLAKFPNAGGLTQVGNNKWLDSMNSGDEIVDTAGNAGIGVLAGGTLEMSNVDLATEFTEMIRAQRGFQANSRIITTSDEILQELVNLKR
jgi:flagellar hook protein FlgE